MSSDRNPEIPTGTTLESQSDAVIYTRTRADTAERLGLADAPRWRQLAEDLSRETPDDAVDDE